jgi:hypothetical protein
MFLRCSVFAAFLITACGQNLSIGIVGGGSLTDAFQSIDRDNILEYSQSKDWAAGAMIEFHLPRDFSIEADGLYRELHLTVAFAEPNGTLNSVSPSPVVTWEFPVLAKYRFHWSKANPFVEAGPAFRTTGNLNATPSHYGVSGGVGVEMHWGALGIAPVIRYTHWAPDPNGTRTNANQIELLLGLSSRSRFASHPLGAHFSVGAVLGTNLTHDFPSRSNPYESISLVPAPGGGYTVEPLSGTDYRSGLNSFLAGPMVEVALPLRWYLEADAVYHPLRAYSRDVFSNGIVRTSTNTDAVTWEFPVLAKYKFERRDHWRNVRPFLEAGPAFRLPQQVGGGYLGTYGVAAGAGVEAHWRGLKIAPSLRFTHWGADKPSGTTDETRNQFELLTGFYL